MNWILNHRKILSRGFAFLLILAMMAGISCSAAVLLENAPDSAVSSEDAATDTTGAVINTEEPTVEGETTTEEAPAEEEVAEEEDVAEEEYTPLFSTTWVALLPPLIAIVLALITKEVYSSLFIGILSGGILYAISSNGFDFERMFNAVVQDGFVANLSDSWNVGILIFLVVLGVIVVMMNRAGGSAAYGKWASRAIKGRRSASLATFGLGALIFVDDYFNCLTVGSVMRPVTDKHCISRAKLAYLIDATAAPICIIAPISSWAAAVSGSVDGVNGLSLFIQTIPYNLYALLTIVMVVMISAMDFDFGPMKRHQNNAQLGDLYTSGKEQFSNEDEDTANPKGKVIDLIIPVVILIILCVLGMIYTGGFFTGTNFIDAFANCDAAYGLALGSIAALVIDMIYFMIRGVLSFKECTSSIPEGFKQMVPAILILAFAWGLKSMTGLLNASDYVAALVEGAKALQILLPAILFLVACGLSFATGTSWGTFGILIPIVTGVFESQLANVTDNTIPSMVVICIAACLAGAVCGDHCSPISDTTIMASAGAKSDHVNHVSTQLPYALTVAAVSLVGYLLAGFVQNVFVVLGVSVVLMAATLVVIRLLTKKKA